MLLPGLALNHNPPVSASQVAETSGMHHHAGLRSPFSFIEKHLLALQGLPPPLPFVNIPIVPFFEINACTPPAGLPCLLPQPLVCPNFLLSGFFILVGGLFAQPAQSDLNNINLFPYS
jgi:hypothetical protein